MQHCFPLVSSTLRWQLTAVLGGSFVLLPYLCAEPNSVASHPTCAPHPTSLYIMLNLRSTSGDAEVGFICLPTQRSNGKVWNGFQTLRFYVNVIRDIRRRPFEPPKNNSRCYWDNMEICLCKVKLKVYSPQSFILNDLGAVLLVYGKWYVIFILILVLELTGSFSLAEGHPARTDRYMTNSCCSLG